MNRSCGCKLDVVDGIGLVISEVCATHLAEPGWLDLHHESMEYRVESVLLQELDARLTSAPPPRAMTKGGRGG